MRGRIFVDEVGTRTGVVLVNPEAASQVVNLTLRTQVELRSGKRAWS